MLRTDNNIVTALPTDGKSIDELLSKEWLLTNSRGGYASSTIVGCNTRRYHGLLVGSPVPLANRIVGLANCMEMLTFKKTDKSNESETTAFPNQNKHIPYHHDTNRTINIATFEFDGKFNPQGFRHLREFSRDSGVHFSYQLENIELTKSIYLVRDADTVALVYDFPNIDAALAASPGFEIEFVVRPFIALRDFHSLQKSYAHMYADKIKNGISVKHETPGSCEVLLNSKHLSFENDPQWWFNFLYRNDKLRGQDYTEDLWSPGFFKCPVNSRTRITLWASLVSGDNQDSDQQDCAGVYSDIETIREQLDNHIESVVQKANKAANHIKAPMKNSSYRTLCLAADQFIAQRKIEAAPEHYPSRSDSTESKGRSTILAGFPWFADWGRDAFISLPGLLLCTGKFDEAKSVLTTFANAADEGMIPNRFDDYSYTAYFNSIDASLWFINAAFEYLKATNDSQTFARDLLPTIRWIADSYYNGTRFDIHADTDELITGGNIDSQLTWMDAKCEGIAFTPRYGKAVEINALWYDSLCQLAGFYRDRDLHTFEHFSSLAQRVGKSFAELFWNEDAGYLNDCILPDGTVDASLRPNQIFAVSLPFCPLSDHQAKSVVQTIEKHLLTDYGLRTLSPEDSRYKGKYIGPQLDRDGAYHQGTVWPWPMGHFILAYLKVNGSNRKTKMKCSQFIQPLLDHLINQGCLGQVNEIFDGDAPQHPRGCIAQAWSVAGLIRAWHLIHS